MIEVFPGLFVGSGDDLIHVDNGDGGIKDGCFVVSAAKEPWHREALGYTTRGAPKGDPEYLYARRARRCILNLIDADDPAYVPESLVDAALADISVNMRHENEVLIHCNEGKSRAPTLALLWLRFEGPPLVRTALKLLTFDQAMDVMREAYPPFAPGKGMEQYARNRWERIVRGDYQHSNKEVLAAQQRIDARIEEKKGWRL